MIQLQQVETEHAESFECLQPLALPGSLGYASRGRDEDAINAVSLTGSPYTRDDDVSIRIMCTLAIVRGNRRSRYARAVDTLVPLVLCENSSYCVNA